MYNKSEMKVRSFVVSKWDNPVRYFFIVALIVSLIIYAAGHVASVQAASNNPMYVSFDGSVVFGGVTYADDDILRFDGSTWTMFFDGSDMGLLSGPDTNAFTLLDADTALFVFTEPVTLSGVPFTPNDIVRFDATSWGNVTAGTFSMYLDGSGVGLDGDANRIDALSVLPDGRVLISTTGNPTVPGVTLGQEEDILAFTPTTPGDYTSGTWAMYFDGSDVGLAAADINALDVVNGKIYLSTMAAFSVTGVSGTNQDVFTCTATSTGDDTACTYDAELYFDGSAFAAELTDRNLDAFAYLDLGPIAPSLTSFTRQTPPTSPTNADTLVFRATFNEAVMNVDAGDFVVNGSTATVTNVATVNASIYDVTVSGGNLASFNGVVGLNLNGTQNITDLDANALPTTEPPVDETYTLDNIFPSVNSILRANPNPTSASSVGFTVTFTESVTGVDAGDFALTTTGVTGAAIANVSGSGAVYMVTVNTGSGDGTIRLDVVDDDSIKDGSNNALGGSGTGNGNYTSGQIYTILQGGADTTGVYRPSNGVLFLKNSNTTGFADIALNYGLPGDYPVVGDWDGNGTATIGIYRNGSFYLRNSNTVGFADIVFAFGTPGDQPIAGDWDGDGIDTIGVYRPSTGQFLLRNSNTAGAAEMSFFLGNVGDVGIAGDWNGDGMDTTGVFRPSNGAIFLKNTNSTGIADIALNYGLPGDKPVMGDWDNDGIDTIGIYRNGTFYLRNSNTVGFADIVFALGIPGDMPIAGDWDGLP
jgi:hypothetical protein